MNNKAILITIAVAVLALIGYVYLQKGENDGVAKRCPEYVSYEPELKAWHWQVPADNDYFPTREEAIKNCVDFWEKQ